MAGQDKTFNAKIVGKVEINAGDSLQVVQRLLKLEQDLTAELKRTANEAANLHGALGKPKSEEELKKLQEAVSKLSSELKVLGMIGKSAKIIGEGEVKAVHELERQVTSLAKAFDSVRKQSKLESGVLGLDQKDVRKALQDLKALETAGKAVNQALNTGKKNDPELAAYKKRIEDNTQALIKHIDALRNATAMEKAHEQALRENAARNAKAAKAYAQAQTQALAENVKRDKQALDQQKTQLQEFLTWRQRARDKAHQDELKGMQKQAEMTYRLANSGRAQSGLARTQLDFTQTGRAAAGYQTQVYSDRMSLLANPAFQAQDQARRQRLRDEQALAEVYRQANVRPETTGFYRGTTDQSEARKKATQEILLLQRQLVDLQQRGVLTDQESLRLRNEIAKKVQDEAAARAKEGNRQAQQNQAERNLARVQGVGGASLLAVQASLMANYSILNGVTGTVRAAVTNSVELEAALKNVQAVTDTTSTEMAGLEERIKSVAAQSKFSSLEVANAALTLGQAGMSAKEVGESIQSVAMLAAASGTSLAQSVDLVTSIVGVFDKNANDVADVANKITAAANNSKVSVDKLALGFQYAGNTSAQAGISFEETTAAMAAMSNAGIRSGSTMGTGLRQFLVEVQKPSEEFLATIHRLGLNLSDLDFKSNGLIGVARRLREAGFIASDAIKSFDVRGAAAFNAMIANPEDMEKQFQLMLDTRAGMKANEIQMDSLRSQTTRMTTSMTNLASVGFEPVSKVLQSLTSNLADAAQGLSQYTTLAKTLGILLAGVITTAMLSHVSSLALGAATLLGLNTAALTALRGMTLLGAGTAIAARLGAAWTFLTGVFAANTVAVNAATIAMPRLGAATALATTHMTVASVATTTWTTVTTALTGALSRLWVVLKGMSLFSGLGIAVAALAAGYYVLGDSAAEVKEELDGLRGRSDEAKGAFKTQQETIESLTNRINELNYKQSEGKTSASDLKTTVMQLNSEFGSIGLTIDSNTSSYGRMIEKLKEAREEMKEYALAKLRVAQEENRKEVEKREEVVKGQTTELKTNAVSTLDKAIQRAESLLKDKSSGLKVLPGQVDTLRAVREEFKAGKTPSTTNLENVRVILSELSDTLKGRMEVGVYGDREKFSKFTEKLTPFITSVSELQVAQGQKSGLQLERSSFEANDAYQQRKVNVGNRTMTLEQATSTLGGNLRAKAVNANGSSGDRLKDFDSFKALAEKERAALEQVEEQLQADLKDPKANTQVVMANLTRVRGLMEGVKSEVLRYAGETQEQALRDYNNRKAVLEARIAMPGKENKAFAAQAIKDKAKLDEEFQTRGIIDPIARENKVTSIREASDQRVANKMYVRPSSGRDSDADIQIRVSNMLSDAELRAADADKTSAGLSEDFEYVQKLWNSGLEHMAESRKHKLEAVEARQKSERSKYTGSNLVAMERIWKEEVSAVNLDFDSRVSQFEDTFKGFSKVASGQLIKMTMSIKKGRQELEDMKSNSADFIYDQGSKLRSMELMRDLGKNVPGMNVGNARYNYNTARGEKIDRDTSSTSTFFGRRGVSVTNGMGHSSSAENGSVVGGGSSTSRGLNGMSTLRQSIAKEIVRVSEYELWENQQFLEKLGDDNGGLIKQYREQLELAEETYNQTQARIKELESLAKSDLLLPNQKKELNKLYSDRATQSQFVGTARNEYNNARGERKQTLDAQTAIQTRIAKNTEELPEETNLDNILRRIETVRDNWQEAVMEMNTNKVVADGISGIMGNMTGNMGNAFSQILSGTKSVSAGFRDMASSIIKSLLDIAAQAAAMQMFKAIVGMMGGSLGGESYNSIGGADMSVSQTQLPMWQGAATGGFITARGKVQRFANGGSVGGAIRGRDSVPALLMPGEFVLKQSAVNAVGTDFLHSLNQASSSVVSSAAPKAASESKGGPNVTNVWIVTPDQQPSGLGANDVIAVVSDNITRGGSVKKLIKQVVSNQV